MGLLDSVLGAVMNGQGGQQSQNGANAAGGLDGLGGLIGLVASNPQLLQAITGMLSNDGAQGGLGGLVAKFQQAGLGDVIGSWVGSGQNQAISGEQLSNVLGSDALAGLAGKLGVSPDDAAGQLSSILPGLIDQLTPQGQAPEGGLGNAGDLMGMLGGLLQNR
ncbi:YidB family protein [Polaromonas sp. P1-6]|nr:YidB family protein [Polaromonas sp. P1-6]UUZ72267.1 YidB family protein [Polaromonas sp. P1(28)-8]